MEIWTSLWTPDSARPAATSAPADWPGRFPFLGSAGVSWEAHGVLVYCATGAYERPAELLGRALHVASPAVRSDPAGAVRMCPQRPRAARWCPPQPRTARMALTGPLAAGSGRLRAYWLP